MVKKHHRLQDVVDRAVKVGPIRLAVVGAGQGLVLDGLLQAKALGLVEPCLIGRRSDIAELAERHGWDPSAVCVAAADDASEAAAAGARLAREGRVDALMKGDIHTDVLMRTLLQEANGLRLAKRRASHVYVVDAPSHAKLICITDAALNIAPDLDAKAQILQNAVGVMRVLGIETPKAALLSAVETVNPSIPSSQDAALLAMMARRGQIQGVLADGPLALDNAVSAAAAREKHLASDVAGDADILLVPDLVSGNILAKALEYFAGARVAGVVVGLASPVILTSRADPAAARVASIALAVLLHAAQGERVRDGRAEIMPSAPLDEAEPNDAESACCRPGAAHVRAEAV